MIGKFENEEALLKSYGDLEREFTKKCQELSRVRKELELRVGETKVSEDVEANEAVEEISQNEELVDFVESLHEQEVEPQITEPVVDDEARQLGIMEVEPEKAVSVGDNLIFRAKANEFLLNNSDAAGYSREIAKVLMKDKSLLSCADPFQVAYALVLKNKKDEVKSNEKEIVTEEKKQQVYDSGVGREAVGVSLLGKNRSAFSPARIVQKYKTMDDAREELLRRFS